MYHLDVCVTEIPFFPHRFLGPFFKGERDDFMPVLDVCKWRTGGGACARFKNFIRKQMVKVERKNVSLRRHFRSG